MKKQSVQEDKDTDTKEEDKQKDFGEGPKQIWYKEPMYLKSRINILFPIKGVIKRKSSTCKQKSRQRIARNYRQSHWQIPDVLTQGSTNNWLKTREYKPNQSTFYLKYINIDGTKNKDVTKVASLEVKINGHKKYIKVAVTDLNRTDMFLEHNWLVKHNPEVNWKEGKIQFTRCLCSCQIKHQDIEFKTRRIQVT